MTNRFRFLADHHQRQIILGCSAAFPTRGMVGLPDPIAMEQHSVVILEYHRHFISLQIRQLNKSF
jgi:hypothetical protein